MSKRLQVLLEEDELRSMHDFARSQGLTLSEWVRQTLRRVLHQHPAVDVDRKLAHVRAASRHQFPTADIDQMLAEIEKGYGDGT